ncbi:MAG: hypothetical protein CM15mL6_240 [uncultured marine virus]|nr:MAG: hypothetical protein CM15mL6_240 [uncultured marine virus]
MGTKKRRGEDILPTNPTNQPPLDLIPTPKRELRLAKMKKRTNNNVNKRKDLMIADISGFPYK